MGERGEALSRAPLRAGAEPPAFTLQTPLKRAGGGVLPPLTPPTCPFPFAFSHFRAFAISPSELLRIQTPCLRVSVLILVRVRPVRVFALSRFCVLTGGVPPRLCSHLSITQALVRRFDAGAGLESFGDPP
jgi:hypothetical protein